MSLEAYEKQEELHKLRAQILLAEEQRIYGTKTISIPKDSSRMMITATSSRDG